MKKQSALNPKPAIILLLAAITTEIVALFLFTRVDKIVHSDLYNYGLIFAQEWASRYWTYSSLIIHSVAISLALIAFAATFILAYSRKENSAFTVAFYMLSTAGTLSSLFSIYNFICIDNIVHHDLYQYGLQFNNEWAQKYWINARLTIALTIFASAVTVTSIILVFFRMGKTAKTELPKLACSVLIATSAVALLLSILYASLILGFVGLGLTFWGIILAYIQPEDYVKRKLLEATTLAPLTAINQIIQELNYEGKAVYLPPKYLKDQEESKAYIPKQKNDPLPTPEQTQEPENSLLYKNPNGLMLTPPGAELAKLFEKMLETPFIRINMQQFQQIMPKIFVEELEIAQNLEIATENEKIHVKIENSNYQNLTEEIEKFPKIHNSLGCPIASALACALAKVIGKPVIIENQKINPKAKTLEIEYCIIEEEEQTKP
jgi:hypothetical protein